MRNLNIIVEYLNSYFLLASKCSRYQFQCRVTLECIAIYNACDGIPQCIDGSDEAQELGCPESGTTRAAPPRQNAAYDDVPLLQVSNTTSLGIPSHIIFIFFRIAS